MKKKQKYIYLGIGLFFGLLIISMIGSIYIYKSNEQVSYFYDKNLGIITTKINERHWFNIIQQQITFAQTTAKVGDTVSFTDRVSDTVEYSLCGINFRLYSSSSVNELNITQVISTPISSMDSIITKTFIPNKVGTWTAVTDYYVESNDGLSCLSTPAVFQGSNNSVVVTAAQEECTKTLPHCGSYSEDTSKPITNGKIEKSSCDKITNDCVYTFDKYEYRTVCNSGYRITGSTDSSMADGELTCELIPVANNSQDCTVTPSLCSSTQVCNPTTKLCVNRECNADLNQTCSDNSTVIITKTCTNGIFKATNNTCPNSNNSSSSTNNTNGTKITCWKVVTNATTCTSYNATSCGSKGYESEKLCIDSIEKPDEPNYILYAVVGSIFAIGIIGIIVFFIVRRRR